MPADLLFLGAPGRTRTCDARFRKPTLYPLSYGGGRERARDAGYAEGVAVEVARRSDRGSTRTGHW